MIGCDFSMGLLEICANERDANDGGSEVFAAGAACLPLRSGVFDAALNVAVLHHVSTGVAASRARRGDHAGVARGRRGAVLRLGARAGKRGGVSGHRFAAQDVLVPFHKRAETKKKSAREDGRRRDRRGVVRGIRNPGEKNGVSTEARVFQQFLPRVQGGRARGAVRPPPRVVQGRPRVSCDCGNWSRRRWPDEIVQLYEKARNRRHSVLAYYPKGGFSVKNPLGSQKHHSRLRAYGPTSAKQILAISLLALLLP